MKKLINNYIKSKSLAWSKTTLVSEKARLYKLSDYIDGNPDILWETIQDKHPYGS